MADNFNRERLARLSGEELGLLISELIEKDSKIALPILRQLQREARIRNFHTLFPEIIQAFDNIVATLEIQAIINKL